MANGLTEKKKRFVREYLIDFNATRAAKDSGYSEKTAYSQGQRLLKDVVIRAAIDAAIAEGNKELDVTRERVIAQLAKIAFSDLKDVVTWTDDGKISIRPSGEVDGTVLQEISETISRVGGVTRNVKVNDRLKALELLGRHMGLFTDNVKLNGDLAVTIVDNIPEEKEESE